MLSTLIIASALAAPTTTVMVQADVLNLRASPSPKAAVMARLRINTYVHQLSQRDDWVEVEIPNRPKEHAVRGWVLARMLDRRPVQMKDALARAAKGDDLAIRRTWAERAVALDGGNDHAWRALETVLKELGDTRALGRVTEARRGGRDVYVGICDGTRAVLAGRLRPGETIHEGAINHVKRDDELLRLLGGAAWYLHSHGYSHPVRGTPFPRPFKTASWNEARPNAYASGGCEAICEEEEDAVILGPCQGTGTIYTTVPMQALASEPLPLRDALALLSGVAGAMHDHPTTGFGVAEIRGTPWRQVVVSSRMRGDYDEWLAVGSWGVIASGDEVKARLGPIWKSSHHYTSVHNPRWFRLRLDGAQTTFVIHGTSGETSSGSQLTLLHADGKIESIAGQHFGGGC